MAQLTPDRLVECLELLHWSTETLAGALECDEGLTEAWVLGLAQYGDVLEIE